MRHRFFPLITFLLLAPPVFGASLLDDENERKILDLLRYASGSHEGFGCVYPAGYHTIKLGSRLVQGQRNPYKRLDSVPYDFHDKTVLDLGTNIGGMLFAVADKIKLGIGIDYNERVINMANRLKRHYGLGNVDFFVFDLAKEPLNRLTKFLPIDKVDICFMLSLAAWVPNWKDVATFASSISDAMLFEAQEPESAKKIQISHLSSLYKHVSLVRATSDDDPDNKSRSLYLCTDRY